MKHLLEEWSQISARSRPQLLIVDDQPLNIRVLHDLFRDGMDVFMATSGLEALDMALSRLPDMILLDIMMKGLDGHEVCLQLKKNPVTANIPVIFITAKNLEAEEAYGFEIGAVDFITKPFNPVIVKARTKTHLAMKLQSDIFQSIAMLDGLTRVANRRKFDEVFDIQWRQSIREGSPLSLIMLDIDYFKLYNDNYGHQAGDECLRNVAQAVQSVLGRPFDLLARYGGEEFICILPHTHAEGAMKVANEILERIRSMEIEHKASTVSNFVTASLGVATTIATTDKKSQGFIEITDKQLYLAKDMGRARIHAVDLQNEVRTC